MRFLFAAALGFGLATTAVVAQTPRQLQVFAGIVDGSGKPVESIAAADVHVLEDGVDAGVIKVERLADWPVKVQLLLDNGQGIGGGTGMLSLKAGVRGLLDALPPNTEVTIVSTAPQPRFLTRPTTDPKAIRQGVDLLANDRGVGRFVESMLEAAQRIERDTPESFPIIVSVGTTSGDRDMREGNVLKILELLNAHPITVHVVLNIGGPQSVSQAGQIQGAAYAGTNQARVAASVTEATGGMNESINNPARLETLLPEIGKLVNTVAGRYRRQYRITAERPGGATGPIGKVNVGMKEPLRTAGLSFDGPVK
jgi:hypothetical protein